MSLFTQSEAGQESETASRRSRLVLEQLEERILLDAPTGISLSDTDVLEKMPRGTRVGVLTTIDMDNPSDSHDYSLVTGTGDSDNDRFAIDGNELVVRSGLLADSYSVRIQTEDAGGNTYQQSLDITIDSLTGTGSFGAQATHAAGTAPLTVTTGDFDADGALDVAVANYESDEVSVLLGDGAGGFGPQATHAAGTGCRSVTTADFDADGVLDLAVANYRSDEVSVLLGDGAGGFAPHTDPPSAAGGNPKSVTAGDFDSDGALDLAVVNYGSNDLSVLLGNGSGGFTSHTDSPHAVGGRPHSVTAGDFDSDGDLDLAVANHASFNVSVLLGDGAGGFASQATHAVGSYPRSLATADFDSDGDLDLALAHGSPGSASVLLGDGMGGFGAPSTFGVGHNPQSVTVGDFDADGDLDLATANANSGDVSVLLGDGSGGFGVQTTYAAGNGAKSVTTGDLDSDGDLDLVVANRDSNNVSVLPGNSPPNNAPSVGTLTDTPDPVLQPDELTLTAREVTDPDADPVTQVQFYLDDGNGTWGEEDEILGTDSEAGDGWNVTVASDALPAGENTYFARANDGDLWSSPAFTTGEVIHDVGGDLDSAEDLGVLADGSSLQRRELVGNWAGHFEDVDMYRFEVPEDGKLQLDIDAVVEGSALDSHLRLFDSKGREVDFSDDGASGRVLQEGQFDNWSFTDLVSPGTSASATVAATGNPGKCVQVTTETGQNAWAIALDSISTWDSMTSGALGNVQMSLDVRSVTGWGEGQSLHLMAQQEGKLYAAPGDKHVTGSSTSWHRVNMSAYTASSFAEVKGPQHDQWDRASHPDFSSGGSEILFGFMAGNSNSDHYAQLYDNWSLTLTPPGGGAPADSYLERYLAPGSYYVGVSNSENRVYDPSETGRGTVPGPTEGAYTLQARFDAGELPSPDDQLSLGALTFEADRFTRRHDGVYTTTGLVEINDLVEFEGALELDRRELTATGNGQVWMRDLPALGDVQLYDGELAFDGEDTLCNLVNAYATQLDMVGMEFVLSGFDIGADHLRLNGHIVLPPTLGGITIDIEDGHYAELTAGGEWLYDLGIDLPNVEMDLDGLLFRSTSAEIALSNAGETPGATITGQFRLDLPPVLENMTVDLTDSEEDPRYFRIHPDGTADLVGEISLDQLDIAKGLYVKDGRLKLNTVNNSYYAEGTVGLPMGLGCEIGGTIGFIGSHLDAIGLTASDLDQIIYHTPPVFVDTLGGSLHHLAPDEEDGTPTVIELNAGLQVGPDFGPYNLLYLDLGGRLDLAGGVSGTAAVKVGEPEEPIAVGEMTVGWYQDYGWYLDGNLEVGGAEDPFLTLDGLARLDPQNNFQGRLNGPLKWMGMDVGTAGAYAQYLSDGNDANDYIIARGEMELILGRTVSKSVEVNLNTGEVDWHPDREVIDEEIVPPPSTADSLTMVDSLANGASHVFDISLEYDHLTFFVDWNEADTDLELTSPAGITYTPENVDAYDNAFYLKETGETWASFEMFDTAPGRWELVMSEAGSLGGYSAQVLKETERPNVEVLEPSEDRPGGPVTIEWTDADTDSDAVVSLYYDTDRSGADGFLIGSYSEDDETDSYTWDTSGVPTGEYYVYAVIDDGENVPDVSYSTGRVSVVHSEAPAKVTGLNAPEGSSHAVRLTWEPSAAPDLDHYRVRLTGDAAADGYERVVQAEGTERLVGGLTAGETYRVDISAVDEDGNVGAAGDPIIVVAGGQETIPPGEGEWEVFAGPETTYRAQMPGDPGDTFALVEGPSGATLSPEGLFEWDVPAGADGWHEIVGHVTAGGGNVSIHRYHLLADEASPQFGTDSALAAPLGPSNMRISVPGARDLSGPLEYRLERDGSLVGDWTGSVVLEDTGLQPNTSYEYGIRSRDTSPTRRVSAWSGTVTAITPAAVPTAVVTGEPGETTLELSGIGADPNPAGTQYAVLNSTSGLYIQADGTQGETPVWQEAEQWGGTTVTGLTPDTWYDFAAMARNQEGRGTQFGQTVAARTALESKAPTVVSAYVHHSSGDVDFEFSEPMALTLKDVTFTNEAEEVVDLDGAALEYEPGTTTATIKTNGLLSDGLYTLTIRGDAAQDLSGNLLDGDGDGAAGGAYVLDVLVGPPSVEVGCQIVEQDETPGIVTGESFEVEVDFTDVRDPANPRAVFSGYADIEFDPDVLRVDGIVHDEDFQNGATGTVDNSAGLVDEVGGTDGLEPVGDMRVFTLQMTAVGAGPAWIRANAGEDSLSQIVVFGLEEDLRDRASYGSVPVQVDAMEFLLDVRDPNGEDIPDGTSLQVGENFRIYGLAKDLRTTGEEKGVFSAYADIEYDTSLIDVTGITHLDEFGNSTSGTIDEAAGLVDELGGTDGLSQPEDRDAQPVFYLTANAIGAGTLHMESKGPEGGGNYVYGLEMDVTDGTRWGSLDEEIVELSDLVPVETTVDPRHVLDGEANLTYRIENQGSGPAGAFEADVVLSRDEVIGNGDDRTAGTLDLEALAAGATATGSAELALDKSTLNAWALEDDPTGAQMPHVSTSTAWIGLVADAEGTVSETNEGNNIVQEKGLGKDDITYFPWDIDDNEVVTPTDAIFTINRLGDTGPEMDGRADFDGNGVVTPTDAIAVINRLGYEMNTDVVEVEPTVAAFSKPGATGDAMTRVPVSGGGEGDANAAHLAELELQRRAGEHISHLPVGRRIPGEDGSVGVVGEPGWRRPAESRLYRTMWSGDEERKALDAG